MKKRKISAKDAPGSNSWGGRSWDGRSWGGDSRGADFETLLPELAAALSAESAPSAVRQRLFAETQLQAALFQLQRPRPARPAALAAALSVVLLIAGLGAGASLLLGRSKFLPAFSSAVHAFLRSGDMRQAQAPDAALPSAGDDAATLPASGHDTFLLTAESEGSPVTSQAGNSPQMTLTSEVFALPYSDPAIASGTETTVRVSVPASQLLAWGIPSARGMDDEVPADLLLGDDGLPQAIRVLPASATTSSTVEEAYP